MKHKGNLTPNDKNRYEITAQDLPLHCPLPSMSLWNSHPRVFLSIEATGKVKCPYCSTEFVLVEAGKQ
ncbi:MAG: zinc-finger domain-containing protein [Pseudomonadota bacterium]|nr:zinc-finger domain-containing protein [Pseudomonadota bacterium]